MAKGKGVIGIGIKSADEHLLAVLNEKVDSLSKKIDEQGEWIRRMVRKGRQNYSAV